MTKTFSTFALIALLLPACAGTRYSYQSALDHSTSTPTLHVNNGDTIELLAIGDGFPGHWGYYPGVISDSSEVASIHCQDERSLIPFREPGIIFGGKVCYLNAHKAGNTTLFFGNLFTVSKENHERAIDVIVNDKTP